MRLLAIVALGYWALACGTLQSSINYTRGTEALEAGDYTTAIERLTEAVRLDPNLSRNHNNLASAYQGAGKLREGWPHIRKAVRLDLGNKYARQNFRQYYADMVKLTGIDVGAPTSQVMHEFGEPDQKTTFKGVAYWEYGLKVLRFENGILVGTADINL